MSYGDRIKQFRKARGISAEQLAEMTGIAPATIYRYENGTTREPKTSMLRKIADALRVDVWEIIEFDPVIADDLDEDEPDHDSEDDWTLREEDRRDPGRKTLFMLSKYGSAKDVKQVNALIDALRATNPEFYDGDDPA